MNYSTIFHQTIVALLACVLCGARISAQETPPAGDEVKPVESPAVPEVSTPAKPVADSKMPDISGTWRIRSWSNDNIGKLDVIEIGRSANGPEEFELVPKQPALPEGQVSLRIPVKWSPGTRNFTATYASRETTQTFSMQLAGGSQSMRVTIEVDEATKSEFVARGMSESEIDELLNQEWTRTPKPVPDFAPTTGTPISLGLSQKAPETVAQQPSKPEATAVPPTSTARSGGPVKGGSEDRQIKIFHLENGSATEYSNLIKELFGFFPMS